MTLTNVGKERPSPISIIDRKHNLGLRTASFRGFPTLAASRLQIDMREGPSLAKYMWPDQAGNKGFAHVFCS